MPANNLVIITGYRSISPKPTRKAYLNKTEEVARERFLHDHPGIRDIKVVQVSFEDELTIRDNGEISAF